MTIKAQTKIILTPKQFVDLRNIVGNLRWSKNEETGKNEIYLSADDKQLVESLANLFYRAGDSAQLTLDFEQSDG